LDSTRRNVFLLMCCQAAFMSTASLMVTIGSLAGHVLATDKGLATLPATAVVVGTALGTVPASLSMRRVGRRLGFVAGAGIGIAGGLLGAAGVGLGSFWLLIAGTLVVGVGSAFGQLYRFAAGEAVEPGRRSRAMSLVLAGGLAAGFVGPQLARATADLLPARFLGAYLCVPLLGALTILLLLGLDLPAAGAPATGPGRPITAIVRQPRFVVAVLSQMAGYGVMNLLMTGTPLAMMAHHGHGLPDAAFVIQWHLVGMFLPGFFTGALVQRLGEHTTILLGLLVNGASLAAAARGTDVLHFWLALTLVGVGWNLMFVGGSSLVTQTYTPAERARAQAANDGLVWTTVAITSLSSGQLLHHHGWSAVLATALPLLALAGAALLLAAWRARSTASTVARP
jgi:MFS family permease